MGIFQEAAILAGDLITQPVRKKVVELVTGQEVTVRKIIEEGALMGNGSLFSGLDWGGATKEVIETRKPVYVADFHAKRVYWELEIGKKK